MSDSQQTRFVRLAADIRRDDATNHGTRVSIDRDQVVLVDHRSLFNRHQLRLHQVLRELTAPGVAVFALHPHRGMVGRLWLSATEDVRSATIGRHSEVDLYLPHDEGLSLRHLILLVRESGARGASGVRLQVLDLSAAGGFQAEQGGVLRAVDANGTLVLRVASYSLFLFPTGMPAPWDPTSADPWQSLPPRTLIADERAATRHPQRHSARRSGETNIEFRDGPSEPGPRPLLAPGERIEGHLVLTNGGTQDAFPVGRRALELGIILGRYSRCAGDTLVMKGDVSRVHAMLVTVNGALHLVDAGSTNGTRSPTRDVKCEPVVGGVTYRLGRMGACWEPTH